MENRSSCFYDNRFSDWPIILAPLEILLTCRLKYKMWGVWQKEQWVTNARLFD